MLYFSTERKISFKITEKRRNLTPLPYAVYPASHPGNYLIVVVVSFYFLTVNKEHDKEFDKMKEI